MGISKTNSWLKDNIMSVIISVLLGVIAYGGQRMLSSLEEGLNSLRIWQIEEIKSSVAFSNRLHKVEINDVMQDKRIGKLEETQNEGK